MIPYQVIETGSKGNAVVVNKFILVDCGVPYKELKPYIKDLKLVLLTHIHGDHFRASTIKKLHEERPTVRFACGKWLSKPLVDAGVSAANIDILEGNTMYGYGLCNVIPVHLIHDVPNFGYKIHFPAGKVFYATDTGDLNGIAARNYDLYLVEANYTDEDIKRRINEKKAVGQYAYEQRVIRNHLSKTQCDDFIYRNIGANGQYAYLHCHVEEAEHDADQS